MTEDAVGALTVVGILSGGGIDCAKLGEENSLPTKNGIWMRISSFNAWIDATIKKELAPGRKTTVTFHDITMITRCIKQPKN